MKQRSGRLAALVVTCFFVSSSQAAASPPVDCSKPEFQRVNTARSLLVWTDGAEERIRKARAQGSTRSRTPTGPTARPSATARA